MNGLPLVRSASPVAARRAGGVGVVGSNPATPTNLHYVDRQSTPQKSIPQNKAYMTVDDRRRQKSAPLAFKTPIKHQ